MPGNSPSPPAGLQFPPGRAPVPPGKGPGSPLHSPRPPTTTQSFSPSGFPRTRNCSAIWYASSLRGGRG